LASGNSAVVAVVKDARSAIREFVKATDLSVKVAGHGIAFAADIVNLCEFLVQNPETDVGSFINEMRLIVQLAHSDVNSLYEQLNSIGRKLLEIITGIRAQQNRSTMAQDLIGALELLNKASDCMSELGDRVAKFAEWWFKTEIMISTLGKVSVNGRRMSPIRLNMVRKNWEAVRNQYEVYSRTIDTLTDFYPMDKTRTSASWFNKLKAVFVRKSTGHTKQKRSRHTGISSWRSLC